jgi:small subunit ribosomal protein S19
MSHSKWKGPFTDQYLIKKIGRVIALSKIRKKQNIVIRTWSRRSTVLPSFVGYTFQIYNGNIFKNITINQDMVGHKLGEFVPTRKQLIHKKTK